MQGHAFYENQSEPLINAVWLYIYQNNLEENPRSVTYLNVYENFCKKEATQFLFKQMSGFISISLLRFLLQFSRNYTSAISLLLSPIIRHWNCKARKSNQSNGNVSVNRLAVQLVTFTYSEKNKFFRDLLFNLLCRRRSGLAGRAIWVALLWKSIVNLLTSRMR